MRKRNKSPKAKGTRAGTGRGGRGGSRGGIKGSREMAMQRQTSMKTSTISTTGYSFHTSRLNPQNVKRREGSDSSTNTGSIKQIKDNHHNDVTGSNGRIPVVGMMNLNGVVGDGQQPPTSSSNSNPNNNFYLHKKFKKVTSTPLENSNELGSATSSKLSSNNNNSSKGSPSANSIKQNGVIEVNGNDSDISQPVKNFPEKIRTNSNSSISAITSSSVSAIQITCSSTALGAPANLNQQTISSSSSSESSAANSQSSSSSNANSSVYKPKFRISTEVDAEETLATSTSSSSRAQESKGKEPSRIERDQRIDRQSLDDRISKIIDENQSILATWPEHMTKRLKSHSSKAAQSPRANNQMVIMSGGSTTEVNSANNQSHTSLNLAKSHLQLLPSASRLPSFEIQNDIGYSSNVQMNPQSHSGLFFTTNPNSNIVVGQSSLDKPTDFSDSSISDLSFTHCGSSSTTTSMVPKKRRRLSPTPSRLCGGEVSELPVNEASSANKNYFQDVDMTVRVSNCGPSGAQVTIRTNNSSSMNSGSIQSAGVGAVHFSPLIDVPLSKNKNSMFFHADHFVNDKLMVVNTKDESCSAIDLKVTKSRGRSPRKSKIHNQTSFDGNATGESLPTTGVPVIDLSFPGNKSDVAKQRVSLISPNVGSSSAGNLESPLITISPRRELAADQQDISDSSDKTPLLSLSSNPNPKRPTFLALKPANNSTKVTDPTVLPSPDTPRGSKQFNQMSMNGNTYTNLGFKVSTRSSYTCLFKAQPMFVPQDTDSKLSMYSNWQPRMTESKEGDVSLSTNDSRVNGRKSPKILYTSAVGKGCDTLTVSSPVRQAPISSPVDSSKPFLIEKLRETTEREASPSQIDISVRAANSPSSSRACSTPESSWTTSVAATAPLALTTKSNGFVRTACLSPPSNSCGSNSSSYQPLSSATSTKAGLPAALTSSSNVAAASFSESSSADESSSSCPRNINNSKPLTNSSVSGSYPCDQPLSLTINQNRSLSGTYTQPEDISTNSSSIHSPVVMNRFDNPRVRIMEGGFESNEDYTYVRGRGRGRYVCEACGIRCKKPSMLRKHLKTHTDLRPYTCKLCNFSFKTKGNLTKHQKSKSHHKKCSSLGIHPNSSRSLAMIGPSFSISDTNTTDDNDSDDDEDDNGVDNEDLESDSNSQEDGDTQSGPENDNENASFEKEIAQSLLDLSKISRLPLGSQSEDSNNTSTTQEPSTPRPQSQPIIFSVRAMLEEVKAGETPGSSCISSPAPESLEAPMDLSVKPRQPNSGSESELKNGYVRSFGIVGEAQRWEPEDDLMLNGCLNLKKVRNMNSSPPLERKPPVNIAQVTIPIPSPVSIPIQVDIKPEIIEIPLESTEKVEIEKPFVNKRKRDSSVSSMEDSSCSVNRNSSPNILPVKGSESLQLNSSPPPQQPAQGSTTLNPTPKQQKLHQPWLSSPDAKENEMEVDTVPPVIPVAPAPPPPPPVHIPVTLPPTTISAQQSASASAAAIVMQQAEETFSPVGLMKSSQEDIDVGTNESMIGSYDSAVDVSSPNSKNFSGHATLKPQAEFRQPSGAQALVKDEGKAECNVCGKTFARASQLTLHMNIHYLERPFRCDPCGVSFRTKGHLIKHRRSSSHDCKVYLTEAWGVANEENPRPFKCPDCKIAFRIHGHLAKHLRSKMHIMRMECLGKLPFGIYFEMEKSGMNLNEIDTTDCDMSLVSLQNLARKIYGENWMERLTAPTEEPA